MWRLSRRRRPLSDLFDFIHSEKNEKQLYSQQNRFIVDFHELYDFSVAEAESLLTSPEKWLQVFREAYLAPSIFGGKKWDVEIRNLIIATKIREINIEHINKIIQLEAIVITAAIPDATIVTAVYECPICNESISVKQTSHELVPPNSCPLPGCNNRRGFRLRLEKCTFVDTQMIQLQERPEELPPGEIPEPLTALLKESLIRSTGPGDRVKVVGIIKAKQLKRGSLDHVKFLEVNSIEVLNRNAVESRLSEERVSQIKELSLNLELEDLLVNSYCPSIKGWGHVKKAIIRCLFGGVKKDKYGSSVRGDIHCLLTGDPGLAKTAMLLFGKDVCTRGVYDTGRGVTGVGLTAALVKIDEKFVLAAGTLALADMGNCFLDEFEKMYKEDREVLHVPMENGIITVSKGGLKAQLNSRCSIVAAMNPIGGRYNTYKTLVDNLRKKPEDFPDSLISRFDLIFIMVDNTKDSIDMEIAERMLNITKLNKQEIISIDLFRDYVAYSKQFKPTIPDEIKRMIADYYVQKRQEMRNDNTKIFTPRQLETIERLIEARARMYLRNEANEEDFKDSVWLHEIYINETWKDPYTKKVDTGPMMGIPEKSREIQAGYIPKIIELMYSNGRAEIDALGERYVTKGKLVDELIACSDGKVGRDRAQEIIQVAIDLDIIWPSSLDKIKLTGDRNRMLGDKEQSLNT